MEFRSQFHWSLFDLRITKQWPRRWFGTEKATNHYLDQWWPVHWHILAAIMKRLSVVPCRNINIKWFPLMHYFHKPSNDARINHQDGQITHLLRFQLNRLQTNFQLCLFTSFRNYHVLVVAIATIFSKDGDVGCKRDTASKGRTQIAKFMGPTWGPPGSRWASCWPHESCYQGSLWNPPSPCMIDGLCDDMNTSIW